MAAALQQANRQPGPLKAKVGLHLRRHAVVLLMGLLAVLTAAESPHHCEPEASGAFQT
jgi:hypothetical protein